MFKFLKKKFEGFGKKASEELGEPAISEEKGKKIKEGKIEMRYLKIT